MPIKDKPGAYEVDWAWMPFIIAANADLIAEVDKKLAEEFSGKNPTPDIEDKMHEMVLDLICEKYKFEGLRDYLAGVTKVKL